MSKANRNDPCPCGSGKKYKKCCERKDNQLPVEAYYEEARQFQKELIDYTMNKHQSDIMQLAEKQPIFSTLDEEAQDLYLFNFRLWAMLSQHVSGSRTILEEYLEEQGEAAVRSKTREIIESWKGTAPALLMIKEITEHTLLLEDMAAGKTYKLSMEGYNEENLDGDSLILGYPIVREDSISFFTPFISIEKKYKEEIVKLMDEMLQAFEQSGGNPDQFMVEKFPEVLDALFAAVNGGDLTEASGAQWADDKQEETARLLQEGMAGDYPAELIEAAQNLWKKFCSQTSPVIRKPEAFAAAVEYSVKRLSDGEYGLAQGKLAEKYHVGASTISKRFKEIEAVMDAEMTAV